MCILNYPHTTSLVSRQELKHLVYIFILEPNQDFQIANTDLIKLVAYMHWVF